MTAWDAIQTRTVDDIEAEVFDQMTGRSDSDPTSPWADLALALCQRIRSAERRDARFKRRLRWALWEIASLRGALYPLRWRGHVWSSTHARGGR
jgi:hypothetical protein